MFNTLNIRLTLYCVDANTELLKKNTEHQEDNLYF